MTEQLVLLEMISWVENRIKETPEGEYYKIMLESLKWELEESKDRE